MTGFVRFLRGAAVFAGLAVAGSAHAQTSFQTLYGNAAFDDTALGTVTEGPDGSIYGVVSGPPPYEGRVYRLAPPATPGGEWQGAYIQYFDQDRPEDGWDAVGGVVRGANGELYGMVARGGANNAGAIYRLSPPPAGVAYWTKDILFSFTGEGGMRPVGELTVGPAGELYGQTSSFENPDNCGTVFRLAPKANPRQPWRFTEIAQLDQARRGCFPREGLTLGPDGSLYGAAQQGGRKGGGTVFALKPAANGRFAFNVLAAFSQTSRLRTPFGKVAIDGSGVIYGAAYEGQAPYACGGVFRITPATAPGQTARYETIKTFGIKGDTSCYPVGVALDGDEIVVTHAGVADAGSGPSAAGGGVVSLKPKRAAPDTYGVRRLHVFEAPYRTPSYSPLIAADGSIIGTTRLLSSVWKLTR